MLDLKIHIKKNISNQRYIIQTLSSWLNKDSSVPCCDWLYPLRNLETMLSMNHCSVNWRWSPGEAKKWRRPVLFITFSPNQSCQEKIKLLFTSQQWHFVCVHCTLLSYSLYWVTSWYSWDSNRVKSSLDCPGL